MLIDTDEGPQDRHQFIPYAHADQVTRQEREVRVALSAIAVLRQPDTRRVLPRVDRRRREWRNA